MLVQDKREEASDETKRWVGTFFTDVSANLISQNEIGQQLPLAVRSERAWQFYAGHACGGNEAACGADGRPERCEHLGASLEQCRRRCDADATCDCVSVRKADGMCRLEDSKGMQPWEHAEWDSTMAAAGEGDSYS